MLVPQEGCCGTGRWVWEDTEIGHALPQSMEVAGTGPSSLTMFRIPRVSALNTDRVKAMRLVTARSFYVFSLRPHASPLRLVLVTPVAVTSQLMLGAKKRMLDNMTRY